MPALNSVPPTPKLHAPKLSSSFLHSHGEQILTHVEVVDCLLLPLFTLVGFQTDWVREANMIRGTLQPTAELSREPLQAVPGAFPPSSCEPVGHVQLYDRVKAKPKGPYIHARWFVNWKLSMQALSKDKINR